MDAQFLSRSISMKDPFLINRNFQTFHDASSFDIDFSLIPTFSKLLKNKRKMRNRGMDAAIRRIASGTR